MALSKLNELYGDRFQQMAIRDHADHPRHAGELADGCIVDLNNPTCGDVIRLTVDFDGDKISNIAFSGHGCTISTASSSMMTEVVLGKTKEEALALADIFSRIVTGAESPENEKLGDAQFLAGVSKFPQRVKCATLPWNALKKAITEGDQGSVEAIDSSSHSEASTDGKAEGNETH